MTVARRLVIHGRVQGVWYRGWAVDSSRGLGLAGWVPHRRHGTGAALAPGAQDAVDRFIALARDGPPAARVERIDVNEEEPAAVSGFEQRPTV
jgi:acylphosphatase